MTRTFGRPPACPMSVAVLRRTTILDGTQWLEAAVGTLYRSCSHQVTSRDGLGMSILGVVYGYDPCPYYKSYIHVYPL